MVVALVGDVVASRDVADQGLMLRRLASALTVVADAVPHLQAPTLTVGDEFQALYADVAGAVEASVRLRLEVAIADADDDTGEEDVDAADGLDVRIGLGSGEVEVTGAAALPAGQSGTAWWRARDAIDAVEDLVTRSQWPRTLRSAYRGDDEEASIVAYLLCQDEILARLDRRDRILLRGLLDGRGQADLAEELAISQPAVAKRQHDHGLVTVVRALETLGRSR